MTEALAPLDLSFLSDWDFEAGVGNYKNKRACVMSAAVAAVRVARGVDMNGATDQLECVDAGVRKLCILRNDLTENSAERKVWALSMIPRIVGTKASEAITHKRADAIARYACRVIAAEAMDSAKLPDEAAKLRALSDASSMSDCQDVARAARDSANKERSARWSAYASAAAYAASAADADADAAAYAAADADADADAAAYAASAAAADADAAAAAAADAYAAAYAAYAADAADAAAYARSEIRRAVRSAVLTKLAPTVEEQRVAFVAFMLRLCAMTEADAA